MYFFHLYFINFILCRYNFFMQIINIDFRLSLLTLSVETFKILLQFAYRFLAYIISIMIHTLKKMKREREKTIEFKLRFPRKSITLNGNAYLAEIHCITIVRLITVSNKNPLTLIVNDSRQHLCMCLLFYLIDLFQWQSCADRTHHFDYPNGSRFESINFWLIQSTLPQSWWFVNQFMQFVALSWLAFDCVSNFGLLVVSSILTLNIFHAIRYAHGCHLHFCLLNKKIIFEFHFIRSFDKCIKNLFQNCSYPQEMLEMLRIFVQCCCYVYFLIWRTASVPLVSSRQCDHCALLNIYRNAWHRPNLFCRLAPIGLVAHLKRWFYFWLLAFFPANPNCPSAATARFQFCNIPF